MSFKVNRLLQDDFGRVSGVVAVNKPKDVTSHDVVDMLRRSLRIKQVGHAGALDPFATGVLIMLVGKATKYSELFLNADKAYLAQILFGIATDSADPEGNVLKTETNLPTAADLAEQVQALKPQFSPVYEQYVPVYSSVKVGGEKLRVLARSAERVEVRAGGATGREVVFTTGDKQQVVSLPKHSSSISQFNVTNSGEVTIAGTSFGESNPELAAQNWPSVMLDVACSKGTYVRALAEDIGQALQQPLPAMLWELTRTRVGDIELAECITPENVGSLVVSGS